MVLLAFMSSGEEAAEEEIPGSLEILQIVEADQRRGRDVVRCVGAERSIPTVSFDTDITNDPERVARAKREYDRSRGRSLDGMLIAPFYQRVNTRQSSRTGEEDLEILLSKAQGIGLIDGDKWIVASWTSPLAEKLPDVKPGNCCEIEGGRGPVSYQVSATARYQRLLPHASDIELHLRDGRAVHLLDIRSLQSTSTAVQPKLSGPIERQYEARGELELTEIISLTDAPQRAALHLPFNQSIIIEGPPGSGKTSIGLMRTRVLLDRQ